MFFIFTLLRRYYNSNLGETFTGFELAANIALITIISPRGHALIFCHHGHGMLMDKRWRAVIRTFIWTTLLITTMYTIVSSFIVWIFIIPVMLLAEKQAKDWVWAAIPKPARRRLRRIWADAARNKVKEEE